MVARDLITQYEGLDELLKSFELAGHKAYLVGGCVRDFLLGVPCEDVDIATDATPEEAYAVAQLHGDVVFTGLEHGTITAVLQKGAGDKEAQEFIEEPSLHHHISPNDETVEGN
jgi:tRNA nucleotidyltransferase/poly(A) polymerase